MIIEPTELAYWTLIVVSITTSLSIISSIILLTLEVKSFLKQRKQFIANANPVSTIKVRKYKMLWIINLAFCDFMECLSWILGVIQSYYFTKYSIFCTVFGSLMEVFALGAIFWTFSFAIFFTYLSFWVKNRNPNHNAIKKLFITSAVLCYGIPTISALLLNILHWVGSSNEW